MPVLSEETQRALSCKHIRRDVAVSMESGAGVKWQKYSGKLRMLLLDMMVRFVKPDGSTDNS